MSILHTIGAAIFSVGTLVSGWLGYTPAPVLGGVNAATPAVFETYLANAQGPSDSTLSLASSALRDGSSLNGYVCLTIDSNTSSLEYECGTASGTTVSGLTRGLDAISGTTTVAALAFSHRRGADVKVTDYPTLTIVNNQLNGSQNISNPLVYQLPQTFVNANQIIDKAYADALAFGAVPAASEGSSGFVQLATGIQAASSTSLGSTAARLVIPTNLSTSTYNAATAPLKVVVTQNSGKIDNNFIATSTLFTNIVLATSTTIGAFNAWSGIGKQGVVFSSVGTTTFSVPSGVSSVFVQVQGGGGDGGTSPTGSSFNGVGAGGGSGGYIEATINVTGTSTIQIYVGNDNQWSTFGTNGYYMSANPGTAGNSVTPGNGGSTNFNSASTSVVDANSGGPGEGGFSASSCVSNCGVSQRATSATGGASYFGNGGWGAGAGNDGAGKQGAVIVRW